MGKDRDGEEEDSWKKKETFYDDVRKKNGWRMESIIIMESNYQF